MRARRWLAGFPERLAGDRQVVAGTPPAHEVVDHGLESTCLVGLILSEVPLDSGQQPDHVLLADLHRSTRSIERSGIGGDAADVRGPSQHEPRAGWAAKGLAAAEQGEVRAFVRETPEVLTGRKLRGRVHDDRDLMPAGGVDQRRQREHIARECGLRNVDDRCRLLADHLRQLRLRLPLDVSRSATAAVRADLHQATTGHLDDRVIWDPVRPVDDELPRVSVQVSRPQHAVVRPAGHARRCRQEQPRGGAARHEGRLVPGERGQPSADRHLQLGQVDETGRRLAHRLEHLRRHQ